MRDRKGEQEKCFAQPIYNFNLKNRRMTILAESLKFTEWHTKREKTSTISEKAFPATVSTVKV